MKHFSVVTWNIQGLQHRWFGTSFTRVLPHLVELQADILCLQEMPDAAKKLSVLDAASAYHIFIPKRNSAPDEVVHGYNHNVILSKYPFLQVDEFVFPQNLGPGSPLESGIRADLLIDGIRVRVYVLHLAIIGAGPLTRLRQLRYLMREVKRYKGPVIVCGDLNTATPVHAIARSITRLWHAWPHADMSVGQLRGALTEAAIHHAEIMRHGFRELIDLSSATWSPLRTAWFELFKLKLDWFFVKKIKAVRVELGDYVSDHRSVRVTCRLDT